MTLRPARLKAYFEAIAKDLPAPSGQPVTSGERKRRKVSTLVRAAGAKNLRKSLRAELADAIADAGLFTDFSFDDELMQDMTVQLSRVPFAQGSLVAPDEKSLCTWVCNMARQPGPLANCRKSDTEYHLANGQRLDILFEERRGHETGYVVVELKHSSNKGAVSQIVGYLRAMQRQDEFKDKHLRGLIVSTTSPTVDRDLSGLHPGLEWDIEWLVVKASLVPYDKVSTDG